MSFLLFREPNFVVLKVMVTPNIKLIMLLCFILSFKRFLNLKVGATLTVTSEGPFVFSSTIEFDNNAADTEQIFQAFTKRSYLGQTKPNCPKMHPFTMGLHQFCRYFKNLSNFEDLKSDNRQFYMSIDVFTFEILRDFLLIYSLACLTSLLFRTTIFNHKTYA